LKKLRIVKSFKQFSIFFQILKFLESFKLASKKLRLKIFGLPKVVGGCVEVKLVLRITYSNPNFEEN
jgi:hypothetical protein